MICGKKRPKYEWAHIIGQVASTREYKSREKTSDGEYMGRKYREGKILQVPTNVDKVMAFEMELKRIYIKINNEGQLVWGCEEYPL